MQDKREEILAQYPEYIAYVNEEENIEAVSRGSVKDAMDNYGRWLSLEFIDYFIRNVRAWNVIADGREVELNYKGEWVTKEQLFENFL